MHGSRCEYGLESSLQPLKMKPNTEGKELEQENEYKNTEVTRQEGLTRQEEQEK